MGGDVGILGVHVGNMEFDVGFIAVDVGISECHIKKSFSEGCNKGNCPSQQKCERDFILERVNLSSYYILSI